jgi:hypothetical protein
MDPLPDNDSEINNKRAVARQRPARRWTGWKVAFSAGPRRWLRTQQWVEQ